MRKAKPTMRKAKSGSTASTSTKIAAVRSRLRRGDVSTIAALTGYDPSHVSRVIRGERNNPSIVDKAYSHVGKRKAKA